MSDIRFSMEITPQSAVCLLPPLEDIYVIFRPNGRYDEILRKCEELTNKKYNPIPHFPARALNSYQELKDYVNGAKDAGVRQVLIIGGDNDTVVGPFDRSMQLIETGLFEEFRIGIAGHPDGSPNIHPSVAKQALMEKASYADYIVTQWTHESNKIKKYVEEAPLPVHVGLAGPCTMKTLIKFASYIGAKNSFEFVWKNKSRVVDLLFEQTPDDMINELKTNVNIFHIFTFGGVKKVNEWLTVNNYL